MQAIFKTGGQQYTVSEGDVLLVDLVGKKEGDEVRFEEVLMVLAEGGNKVGTPVVEGATVVGKVLSEVKGEKVRAVFFRRRKDSRTVKGHRQRYNRVKITAIEA